MRPNNRLGTLGVPKLRAHLTPRDEAILRSISQHKFLTTNHLHDLHFWNHASRVSSIRACTRVLTRLEGHRLIRRLDRTVGGHGGGSTAAVWSIDAAGDRVVRALEGRNPNSRSRAYEPSLQFLDHTLAIADTRIRLERLARVGHIELLDVATEPTNWRPFSARGRPQTLKPDLHAVTASGDYEDAWFIEVDRGTESLPVLLSKCHYYQRFYATNLEQERSGIFPVVLWIIPGQTRRHRLTDCISTDPKLDARLFRIIANEDLEAAITGPEPISTPVERLALEKGEAL
ncbi:MAG TPA: replication-relaxation family protein [Pseudolysinimonas sp.]|nr:replication-relaxation family protein [Pseudolysinimonas sp.]